jgi:glycosyltransferase involved in cell wall biosynthesis
MAAAAERLCSDENLRRKMGESARAGALARFSRAPMVTRYEKIYERVLKSSPSNS